MDVSLYSDPNSQSELVLDEHGVLVLQTFDGNVSGLALIA